MAPDSGAEPDSLDAKVHEKPVQATIISTFGPAGAGIRTERDLLGDASIPENVYWGVHTLRAVENFPITGVSVGHFPDFVRALVLVKAAAARTNKRLGHLSAEKCSAIERACALIVEGGQFHDQFVVDMVQGGAGTSTNMNVNEVIANVALETMGRKRGDYAALHPNDDVNKAQSTNDAYPTALRLAIIFATEPLITALNELAFAFKAKAVEFSDVLKIGRTQLQDAVPMTLGQEFDGFFATIKEDVLRLQEALAFFREVNLGATAIGTGITADARYAALAVEELARLSGQPMVPAANLVEATSDMGAFVHFSGVLKRVAVKLSKICNDLRLLSSGPQAGFGEIRLPPVQAGSSIMPGKINPVIPEVVNQIAFMVIGHDLTITLCAEGGQLQLNAFEPTIGYCLLSSLRHLTAGIETLTTRCINGIEANREKCLWQVENSFGLATALGPSLGYEAASRIAKRAYAENRRVVDVVREEGLLTDQELADLLTIDLMTAPRRMGAQSQSATSASLLKTGSR